MSKSELIDTVLNELRRAEHERWVPPPAGPVKRLSLPPVLPVEGGGHISATMELIRAVAAYSRIWSDNQPSLKLRFKASELEDLAYRAFGDVLSVIDRSRSNTELAAEVRDGVDKSLSLRARFDHKPLEVILGCHLFRGDDVYPLRIGPVLFESRDQWRDRSFRQRRLSTVTNRRLGKLWAGGRIGKRKRSLDEDVERSVMDAVGECPVICTIETDGLSSKMIRDKALLAARLAMTATSLLWDPPAEGLGWMNLIFDGRVFHRRYALFTSDRYAGSSSSISRMPTGRWTDPDLLRDIQQYQPLFDVLGDAISAFVQPNATVARPKLGNSVFLSLWWLQAGCRDDADQIATTKFVASMDALVKGQSAQAILAFLKARNGYEPNSKLMADGRTAKNVLTELYNLRRSQLLHGSSVDFAHDWSKARSTAEVVARLCLVLACAWIAKNPTCDNVEALSLP